MSNSSTSRPRWSSVAWRRTSRNTADSWAVSFVRLSSSRAAPGVVEHAEPAVVGAERADAGVARAAVQERGGQAVGGGGGELGGQVRAALLAREAVGLQQRHQPAGEQHLARGPQLGVADAPLLAALALLADEVHADRAPVADQVVEEEPRRAVRLVGVLQVAVEHPLPARRCTSSPAIGCDSSISSMRRVRLALESASSPIRDTRSSLKIVVPNTPLRPGVALAARRATASGSGRDPVARARPRRARAQSSSLRRVSSRRPHEPNSTTARVAVDASAPSIAARRRGHRLARALARRGQVRELGAEPLQRARQGRS